jgi:hypothetical protein
LEDEDEEKYTLSLSILNFIKSSSLSPGMYGTFMNKSGYFKKILRNEEEFSTARVKRIPIDIENSYIGRGMNCLVDCLDGTDCLSPYTDVSLRVIMRIADVLMNKHECKVFEFEV